MDELELWLIQQIAACENLTAAAEQKGDQTKVAEYFFGKLAYEVVLEKLKTLKAQDPLVYPLPN